MNPTIYTSVADPYSQGQGSGILKGYKDRSMMEISGFKKGIKFIRIFLKSILKT